MSWSGGSGKPGLDSMSSTSAGTSPMDDSEPEPDPNPPLSEECITDRREEEQ